METHSETPKINTYKKKINFNWHLKCISTNKELILTAPFVAYF